MMRSRSRFQLLHGAFQRKTGVVALPFPLDEGGAGRLERLSQPPGRRSPRP